MSIKVKAISWAHTSVNDIVKPHANYAQILIDNICSKLTRPQKLCIKNSLAETILQSCKVPYLYNVPSGSESK